MRTETEKPLSRNPWIMRWLAGMTSALKVVIPLLLGRSGQLREHQCRDPVSLPSVGDDERHLGTAVVDPA